MTAFDQQLLLHLRLDALVGGAAPDDSAFARHGAVAGRPTVVPDERFGSSVRFGGADSVAVAGVTPRAVTPNPVHTVTGWLLLDAPPPRPQTMLTWGQAGAGAQSWLVTPDGRLDVGVRGGKRPAPAVRAGNWTHVAVVHDGAALSCYVDGVRQGDPAQAAFAYSDWTFAVARAEPGGTGYAGRLAGIRVYERALTAEELRQVIDEDQNALAVFRHSHPLAFSLHDKDDQPVLAITDDPAGTTMTLEVTNTASQSVALTPSGQANLELTLRPGTVPVASVATIAATGPAGWTTRTRRDPDGSVVLAFARRDRLVLAAGETVRFTLTGLGADGRGGTRGTRVQLRYRSLSYVDETSELAGRRVQLLSIVNRRGREYVPLDVGLVGTTAVLNDGASTNTVTVRIANVSTRPIALTPAGQDAPSAFVVAFDVRQPAEPANEWAVGTPDQLKSVGVTADRWTVAPSTEQGKMLTWRLTTSTQVALAGGAGLHVTITGLIAEPPTGHTKIHIYHENIPGYWDGHQSVAVQKGPLVVRDVPMGNGTEARVGIGTSSPQGRLHILHAPQDANGNALVIGPSDRAGAANLRLGYNADYSWIQSHGLKPLAINPLGNRVGIGRTTPEATLDVARGDGPAGALIARGTERFSHFAYSTDEHTYIRGGKAASNVYLNDSGGNVAIGSTDPQGHKLLVNGPVKVLGLRVNSNHQFGRMQAGHFQAGPGKGGVLEVRVDFPEPFGTTPRAVVTVRNEGFYTDTFAVTVKYIEATHFKANILRLDAAGSSWGQNVRLDWIAWE